MCILAGVYTVTAVAILPLLFILPARLADKLLPNYYGTISDATVTVLIVLMLVASILLTRRCLQISETETI